MLIETKIPPKIVSSYILIIVAVICYYASWLAYQGITPEVLDPGLCTHINYAFIHVWDNGNLRVVDDNLEIKQGKKYINFS